MNCGWRWENKTWECLAQQVLTVPLFVSCGIVLLSGSLATGTRKSGHFSPTNELNPGWIGGVVGLT